MIVTDEMVQAAQAVIERGHSYLSTSALARDMLEAALGGRGGPGTAARYPPTPEGEPRMNAIVRTYLYNPRLWLLAGFGLLIMGYTTRCGDALR